MIKTTLFSFLLAFCLMLSQSVLAQHDMQADHGKVSFETSCSAEAASYFEHGLGMIHHMMYDQAYDIFRKAVDADSNCAIAYWGIAMTQLNPLWAPPSEQMFSKGQDAIKKASSIGTPSEKEKAHIEALYRYYKTTDEAGYREGLKAWTKALEEVYHNHPDDIDAGAFYGLSLLATASPDDNTFSQQSMAGEILEELFKNSPEHPGLFHYIIHAYDNPVLADKGVEFAHGYDKLAPDVPHALHMPSHIFVRIGSWPETIDWNRRSADAALRQPVGDYTSMHHAHALDYMMYGYLQKGLDTKAKDVLDELLSVDNYQPHFGAAYAVAAAQARYFMEQRKWQKAADLNLRKTSNFPWDDFPQYEAIGWWASGLGAIKTANTYSAQKSVEKLKELHQNTVENGEDYWALLVDVQRKTVEAWIAQEKGDYDKALNLMREAADQEDSVDKHPVTPGEVLPARELLGDMLLLHEKPEEALAAYEKTLEFSPNRFHSLFGAGKAAYLAEKKEQSEIYFTKLHEITVPEQSDRAELEQVAVFLNRN